MIDLIGYFCAILIGLSLGLIGGGGSILTVPVLVYLFGFDPILSTAYSLFIVGVSALIGGINYAKQGLVDYKTGVIFIIPAFISVYLTRLFLIPMLPDVLFNIGAFSVTKNLGILLLFALLMIVASISMIRKKSDGKAEAETSEKQSFNYPLIILEGAVVGVLTGMVGAGGGFLIIPALVILAKLPMKVAVGTSLLIIAVKSLFGFVGDLQSGVAVDWTFLSIFSGLAILGIFVGMYFAKQVDGAKLKKGFGYFVLVMGVFMVIKELFL